jgi:hypothetical protein
MNPLLFVGFLCCCCCLLLLTDETGRGSLLACAQEEIFASSFAAAAYLQSIDFPKDKKVPLAIRSNVRNMREV